MIFIKRSLTDSHEQLSKDFGEFPLSYFVNSPDSKIQFFLVQTSPLNRKIFDWLLVIRGIRNGDTEEYADLRSGLQQKMTSLADKFKELVADFQAYTTAVPVYFRIFVYLLFLIMAVIFIPLFGVVLLAVVIYVGVPVLFRKTLSSKSLGFFNPILYKGKPEIVVTRKVVHGRLQEADTAIVTHEHVHLLQHQKFPSDKLSSRHNSAFYGGRKESLESILEKPAEKYEKAAYYFLLNEMEARLHEIVLSSYRKQNVLPISLDEFVDLLLGVQSDTQILGDIVAEILEGDIDTSERVFQTYAIRCEQIEEEFINFLFWLKDVNTRKRFLLEVLPVMYANLLVIYGYPDESSSFLETIECRDLFDELYGPQDASLNCDLEGALLEV